MTITYLAEGWDRYAADPDLWSLWKEHYDEFAPVHKSRMPMGPDVRTYKALADAGALEVLVARKDGKMIGYCLFTVRRHLHYDALAAFEDSYFVTKSERQGYVGLRLIKMSLARMRERGATVGYWMTKEFNSIAVLFERLGLKKMDSVYACWLKEQ